MGKSTKKWTCSICNELPGCKPRRSSWGAMSLAPKVAAQQPVHHDQSDARGAWRGNLHGVSSALRGLDVGRGWRMELVFEGGKNVDFAIVPRKNVI